MGSQLNAIHTPAIAQQVMDAFKEAWPDPTTPPNYKQLCLLVAHSDLETGRWASMYCWNLGNAKASGMDDYCYYQCGEDLANATAQKFLKADPAHVFLAPGQNPDAPILDVRFLPPHPMCKFRAFKSLVEAARDHLGMLKRVFPKAWAASISGDPLSYAAALKAQGYYTAPEGPYSLGIKRCLGWVKANVTTAPTVPAVPAPAPLPVPLVSRIPVLVPAQIIPAPLNAGYPAFVSALVLLVGILVAMYTQCHP